MVAGTKMPPDQPIPSPSQLDFPPDKRNLKNVGGDRTQQSIFFGRAIHLGPIVERSQFSSAIPEP